MASHSFRNTSVRAAGVLTLSGLMVGGVVLAQGAGATDLQPAGEVSSATAVDAAHADYTGVPRDLARPVQAPKTHRTLMAEKKAAEARADARRAKQEAEKKAASAKADETSKSVKHAGEVDHSATEHSSAPKAAASADTASSDSSRTAAPAASGAVATVSTVQAAKTSSTETSAPSTSASSSSSSSSSSKGAAIAAAAKAQIGVGQDCTMLATNALKAVGINFHGWPKDYLSLGHTVSSSEAQPGDLIYYASNGMGQSHIAVYIGNGQAIHGGWEGGTTAQFSAYLPSASAPVFIHVDR